MPVFLKRFLFQLLSGPIIYAIGWTPRERDDFDRFCRTSCGAKLLEYLRQVVARTTFNAVYQQSVSANSYARGQQDVLMLLHRLRVFPELQEESNVNSLADSEIPEPPSRARSPDDWPWVQGGRGAIG